MVAVTEKNAAERAAAFVSNQAKRIVLSLIVVLVAALSIWFIFRPRPNGPQTFTGYVVADNLYLSSPIAGSVEQLWVARGQRVSAGARLFRIDPTSLAARAQQARTQIGEATASVEANRAALAKARAAYAKAETEAESAATDLAHYRGAERDLPGSVAGQQIDQAHFTAAAAAHQKDAAREDMNAAEAGIASTKAQVARAKAGLTDAERQLEQLSPHAPMAGTVEDTLFQRGEWVSANAPVISLIPDGQVKVRFYVPQAEVAHFRPGTRLDISCDGCEADMTASVDRVATRPEFTPPVIYSLRERDKLVFMVEAVPATPQLLTPGQPIDVSLAAGKRR
jgi:HlyD family secretion protein